jgi:menaquinone-dependent protoporphyrinogen oxidase
VSVLNSDTPTMVLVAYASKHGSTTEVAEALGRALRGPDVDVDVVAVADVHDLEEYDAVVLGGSLYVGRWHRDAVRFLERHRKALVNVPLAVYALGPKTLAESEVAASRSQLESALSKLPALEPVAVAIFGGVVDPTKLRFPLTRMAPSDARNWDEIAAWANEIRGLFTNRTAAISLSSPEKHATREELQGVGRR